MIRIYNISSPDGSRQTRDIDSPQDSELDGEGKVLLPALVDPHVHFRTPGLEYKEDWISGAAAAFAGGVTTVCDMPNTIPATTTAVLLAQKRKIIDDQIKQSHLPLRYELYLGASTLVIQELPRCVESIVGVKLFLGSSTGNMALTDGVILDELFSMAKDLDVLIAIHAEDDATIAANASRFNGSDSSIHSRIRSRESALIALDRALALAAKYKTRTSVLHVSTREELDRLRSAKSDELPIAVEVTPHHLFLDESIYSLLGSRAKMNPPLRTAADREALWEGIIDGTVDMIGTDHAPHTLEEKDRNIFDAPSGVPGIENYLSLLFCAQREGRISLEKIVALTSSNPRRILRLPEISDCVIVERGTEREIRNNDQKTKCRWSPYAGWKISDRVSHVIVDGRLITI